MNSFCIITWIGSFPFLRFSHFLLGERSWNMDELWCLDCIFLSWKFSIGKCIDGWIYLLTCKYEFDAIFFYSITYIDHGIFTILGLIVAWIYCLIVELCFYIAYLYVWTMFVEQFFLEIEAILISHLDLQTKYKCFKVTLFFPNAKQSCP